MRVESDNTCGIIVRVESDGIYEGWLITAEPLANISEKTLLNEDQTQG